MSFLDSYVNQHKQTASNMKCAKDEENEVLTSDKETYKDSNTCHSESCSDSGSFKPFSLSKQWKQSPAEVLAVPMTKFHFLNHE